MTRTPLALDDKAVALVSLGQATYFPSDLIEDMAIRLGSRTGEYIPVTECEAAVVSFVRALQQAGWTVLPPEL